MGWCQFMGRAMLGATGRDLPAQANQQDAATSAAQHCRIDVHKSCKYARMAVSNSFRSWLEAEPPHLLSLHLVSAARQTGTESNRNIPVTGQVLYQTGTKSQAFF